MTGELHASGIFSYNIIYDFYPRNRQWHSRYNITPGFNSGVGASRAAEHRVAADKEPGWGRAPIASATKQSTRPGE
jgi:hypothetical protein